MSLASENLLKGLAIKLFNFWARQRSGTRLIAPLVVNLSESKIRSFRILN